jgi:hypothetical protein
MLKREKQVYIVQHADMHNKVLSNALSKQIALSEDTISNISYPSKKDHTHNNSKVVAQKAANLTIPRKINTKN